MDTMTAIILVIQLLVSIVIGSGIPWAMKVTSQLSKLDAKLCVVTQQAKEHASLEVRIRALELSMARCGHCNYIKPSEGDT